MANDFHQHHDDKTIELLTKIAHRVEMYKLTMVYIAVLLTFWLILKVTGVIS